MDTRLAFLLFAAALWLAMFTASALAQEEAEKVDALAKEAAEQFMKGMKAENVEAVVKVAGLPFFWDGKRNIKDREELKREFTSVFADKDLTKMEYTVKHVYPFSRAPEKFLDARDQELLKEVLRETDRIVLVELKGEGMLLMVQIREGKANVAGFRD